MNRMSFTAEPGKPDVLVMREFDAPRAVVFRAFTDPGWYARWFGTRGTTMVVDTFEARSGGSFRYVQKLPDGREFAFHGVFHEVTSPSRIIQTSEFEGMPESGHVSLITIRFDELPGGRTRVTHQILFQSVAERDQRVQWGTERGYSESFSRLDELLAETMKGQIP